MRTLSMLIILLCLIPPLNADGQKRMFLASASEGLYFPGGKADSSYGVIGFRFGFTHPERKVGPHLWLVHHMSVGSLTGYDLGLASMGKRHYVSISAGPILVTPLDVTGFDYWDEYPWILTGGVTIGAYYLPMPAAGLGFIAQGHPEGVTFTWSVFVRAGWKRLQD